MAASPALVHTKWGTRKACTAASRANAAIQAATAASGRRTRASTTYSPIPTNGAA